MGIEEVTQKRIEFSRHVCMNMANLAFLTMLGGGITAIVGHARQLPKVVEIGRWIALGGGVGILSLIGAAVVAEKVIRLRAIWT